MLTFIKLLLLQFNYSLQERSKRITRVSVTEAKIHCVQTTTTTSSALVWK